MKETKNNKNKRVTTNASVTKMIALLHFTLRIFKLSSNFKKKDFSPDKFPDASTLVFSNFTEELSESIGPTSSAT